MVPGVGGGELVVIAVVALIVVGPKDLPKLLRYLGRFVGKMRRMADEFRTSFEDMARQTELDELRKEVDALRAGQMQPSIVNDINQQMRAIESDINAPAPAPAAAAHETYTTPNFTPSVTEGAVEAKDLTEASPKLDNPQLDGKPPRRRAKAEATPAPVEPSVTPAKKPRARKTATPVEAAPAPAVTPARKPARTRKKVES